MQNSSKRICIALALGALALSWAACGVEDEPHYEERKDFGHDPDERDRSDEDPNKNPYSSKGGRSDGKSPGKQDSETEEETESSSSDSSEDKTSRDSAPDGSSCESDCGPREKDEDSGGGDEKKPGDGSSAGESSSDGEDGYGQSGDSAGGEKEPLSPDTIIADYEFKGHFDLDNLYVLSDDSDEVPYNGSYMNVPGFMESLLGKIRSYVTDRENRMRTRATYGDGVSRSRIKQYVSSPLSDYIAEKTGKPTQSGEQTVSRVYDDPECPSPFICARKMTFRPADGSGGHTTCYFAPQTREPAAIPYSPAPNNGRKAFEDTFGETYGPFVARKYRGTGVDCSNPPSGRAVAGPTPLYLSVYEGNADLEPSDLKHHRYDPLAADFEVVVVVRKSSDPERHGANRRPYPDEFRLQAKSRFFINEAERVIVKMIKNVRLPFTLKPAGSWIGSWAERHDGLFGLDAKYFNIDGLWTQYHLEFCRRRGGNEGVNHCGI